MPRIQPVGLRPRRNFSFLYELATCKTPECRQELLSTANTDQLATIAEICANILQQNFALNKRQRERLGPYREFLPAIAKSHRVTSAKKFIRRGDFHFWPHQQADGRVVQKGGALLPALLLPVLIELAATGVDHLLSRYD